METNKQESIVNVIGTILLASAVIALAYFNKKQDEREEYISLEGYYSLTIVAINNLEEIMTNVENRFFLDHTDIMNYRSRVEEYKNTHDAKGLKNLLTEVREQSKHRSFLNKPPFI